MRKAFLDVLAEFYPKELPISEALDKLVAIAYCPAHGTEAESRDPCSCEAD